MLVEECDCRLSTSPDLLAAVACRELFWCFLFDIHRTSSEKPSHVTPNARHVMQAGRFWSHFTWRRRQVLQPPNAWVRRGLVLAAVIELNLVIRKYTKYSIKSLMPFGSRCDRGELNHLTKRGVITCRNNLPIRASIVWPTTVEDGEDDWISPGTMG